MEHIFLLCAPQSHSHTVNRLVTRIRIAAAQTGALCLIRECRNSENLASVIRRDMARGGVMRFYVYGSDAELCAAARAALGVPNVEIGIIPDARGCDFTHNYPDADFSNPFAQLSATPQTVDMIDCNRQHFLNAVRICASDTSSRTKALVPPVSLAAACDDGSLLTGAFVFAGVGNGMYSGGNRFFHDADPSDGWLNLTLRRSPPLHGPSASVHKRFRRLTWIPHQPLYVCGDGQSFRAQRLSFAVIPGCVRILIPAARAHRFPFSLHE